MVNRTESPEEGSDTFGRLEIAAHRFLQRGLADLGSIPEDSGIRRLVRRPEELRAAAGGPLASLAAELLAERSWAESELPV